MTAEELMIPRFMVMYSYPHCPYNVGVVLSLIKGSNNLFHNRDTLRGGISLKTLEEYPHLFRKMNWWELRTEEQMPKKLKSLAHDRGDIYEIELWDMQNLYGYIDVEKRTICSLLSFKPEFGYIPVD